MLKRFRKDEKGNGFIVMVFTVLICIAFFELIWEVGSAYLAKEELQHYTDAAAMGGNVIAAEGYTHANGDGGSSAIVVRAKAENKASEILNANEDRKISLTKRTLKLTNIDYNNADTINGNPMNANQQYFSGYFTVEADANYIPKVLDAFKNIVFHVKSRVQAVTVE